MKTVLVAGGTGLVGSHLCPALRKENYRVCVLSRSRSGKRSGIEYVRWNPEKKEIPESIVNEASFIINLSGANVAAKRWDRRFRQEILDSRVQTTQLLTEAVAHHNPGLEKFLNASAIGIYGYDRSDEVLTEASTPGEGFLAEVSRKWEQATQPLPDPDRLVLLRIGIVLARSGGALLKMVPPVKLGVGSPLASGRQWLAWIDIEDLVRMFMHLMKNPDANGPYNAVAPQPERNRQFMKKLARQLKRPFFFPNVPRFALELMLGEFAETVSGGLRVLPVRLQEEDFEFRYPQLEQSLKHLLG